VRFDVHELARDCAPPRFRPSRARPILADAALWQTAEFVAARVAERSTEDVWTELRRFTAMDEIWGPGTDTWPNDSLLFATGDGRALCVYAIDEARCRFCGRPHRNAPAHLCPPAGEEYDRAERWGEDLGLDVSDPAATGKE
jgi:hypothetical protein